MLHGMLAGRISTWGKGQIIAALLVVTAAVYANVVVNGFTIDDPFTYLDNPEIRDLGNFRHLLDSSYFSISREASYRPVCTATYFLDWALWQANPVGPHLTNIVIYLGVVTLLFLCFTPLVGTRAAGMGALLFAVHPVHTEVVNNISFREDLLATLLMLAAWRAGQRYRHTGAAVWIAGCGLFYLLATLAKEFAVVFPVLMVLLDIACRDRGAARTPERTRLFYLVLGLVTVFYLGVRFVWMAYDGPGEGPPAFGLGEWFVATVKIQARYLVLLCFPFRLQSYYAPAFYSNALNAEFALGLGLLSALLAALVVFRRSRWFVVGLFWWGIAMAPVVNIYPLFQPIAERYLFWASIGPCLWAGWALSRRMEKGRRVFWISLLACIVLAWGASSLLRNRCWRNEVSIWKDAREKNPPSAVVEVHLATAFYNAGRFADAVSHGVRALELSDEGRGRADPAIVHLTLGGARYMLQDRDRAHQHFLAAERNLPTRFDVDLATYMNLGMSYKDRGELLPAIDSFDRASRLAPNNDRIWSQVAHCYLMVDNTEAARRAWNQARAVRSDLPPFEVLERAYRREMNPR